MDMALKSVIPGINEPVQQRMKNERVIRARGKSYIQWFHKRIGVPSFISVNKKIIDGEKYFITAQ